MSSLSKSSSSWSNLPLDLLLSIKKNLELYQRFDLTSFRSVCSHWCSVMPIPNPFPCYEVSFNKKNKIIQFIISNNASVIDARRSIQLSFSSSSPVSFFCSSNGWLVFTSRKNGDILHLFDPVSSQKHIFPPLSPPNLVCHHSKFKSNLSNASKLHLSKVIVSSNDNNSIAVAGIVQITNRSKLNEVDRRFVFYKHSYGRRWNLFMEESKGIVNIALAGDGRFYAIGEDWELYMLDERLPMMKLKKFKLWLPKHIFESDPETDPIGEQLSIKCCGMEESGRSNLKIYGCCERFRFKGSWISLKLDVTKLYGSNSNVDVVCEAEWHSLDPTPYYVTLYFTPSFRSKSPKVEEQNNK